MEPIRLDLTMEEANALLRVLDLEVPNAIREIHHAEFSFDFRKFLRKNYENLEKIRTELRDACSAAQAPAEKGVSFVVSREHEAENRPGEH